MAKMLFKYRPNRESRRGRVAQLRNVLPRHHMGRVNRTPMTKPAEASAAGS